MPTLLCVYELVYFVFNQNVGYNFWEGVRGTRLVEKLFTKRLFKLRCIPLNEYVFYT
jgi:hypothetical protein